eukprot:CAMPEP_0117757456 /NCGR_PEP_ID=MMETSP0947-20121206/14750_1 /TAXON_ID=44440 /ORGANISM="Chattonella subsalsa, Strain CCMP2191" /LENGTH=238 /DNA_ID=CAMNT_0005577369 /DNA_START=84 /DNA_END=800 /DNA_ORIENTATION=-
MNLTVIVLLFCVLATVSAINVVVTLRGTKYDVSAEKVSDIQKEIEEQAGLSSTQQAVLYKGKILEAEDNLVDVGVSDGETLNIVPNRRPKAARPAGADSLPTSPGTAEESPGMGGGMGDLFGSGASGSGAGGMPSLEDLGMSRDEYESMMDQMYDSEMFEQLFSDPEQLEMTRKAILENPMMKQAMEAMPGFSEIINDPEAWKEAMMQAKELMDAQKKARDQVKQKNNEIDDLPEDEV